jgi:hypothetical protein
LVVRGFILLMFCLGLVAWADGKKGGAAQEYAIIGGTVFRDTGLALADADVTLEVAEQGVGGAGEAKPKSKVKKLKAVSSPRGEFTFRVPPVAMKYKITVTAKGFTSSEKIVAVEGASERVDATFSLSPESKH